MSAFTADAAHELRTPLAAIKIQAEVALAAVDEAAIDPATQARLRDRFYRAEGNAAEGSGLGLSIVDKIAQAYGARLELGPGLDGNGFGAAVRWR